MRKMFTLGLVALACACGGSDSPTSPSNRRRGNATRIIALEGNLGFGELQLGDSRSARSSSGTRVTRRCR